MSAFLKRSLVGHGSSEQSQLFSVPAVYTVFPFSVAGGFCHRMYHCGRYIAHWYNPVQKLHPAYHTTQHKYFNFSLISNVKIKSCKHSLIVVLLFVYFHLAMLYIFLKMAWHKYSYWYALCNKTRTYNNDPIWMRHKRLWSIVSYMMINISSHGF